MSYTKIFIHGIFIVKDRRALITQELEPFLFAEMSKQIEKCKSKVLAINGSANQVHVLISMHPDISYSALVKQVKGATSYKINSEDLIKEKYSWQKGVRGFSVSQSILSAKAKYIRNQKEHYKKKSFKEEYEEISKLHNHREGKNH